MNIDEQVKNHRAIEALRNGVPNRDAVKVLGCNQPDIEEKFRQQLQCTVRSIPEGGKNEGMMVAGGFGTGKSHLLEYLMHLALLKLAKDHHCRIIISYHNENETPLKRQLNRIVSNCFSQGADIVKVACRIGQRQDMLRIIALYEHALAKEGSVIALGMGARGKLTRIAAPLLGAPFTYAALVPGKETAAGQMSVFRMAKMISELKGA